MNRSTMVSGCQNRVVPFWQIFIGTLIFLYCSGQRGTICHDLHGAEPSLSTAEPMVEITYEAPIELCRLANKDISESSGLATSRRYPNRFWTHNDSGDEARLFAFDIQGKHLGTCRLKGVKADDWEDICSYEMDGVPYLLVADVGDNGARRKTCQLYIFPEPKDPKDDIKKKIQTVTVTYASGPVDCEAVGVDPVRREIVFIEKAYKLYCRVFVAPLPAIDDPEPTIEATPISRLNAPVVTALDVAPDGLRVIVMTVGQAFEYRRTPDETWEKGFARPRRTVDLPARRQGEAICYGQNGVDLYLTSEFSPTPFFLVKGKAIDE